MLVAEFKTSQKIDLKMTLGLDDLAQNDCSGGRILAPLVTVPCTLKQSFTVESMIFFPSFLKKEGLMLRFIQYCFCVLSTHLKHKMQRGPSLRKLKMLKETQHHNGCIRNECCY